MKPPDPPEDTEDTEDFAWRVKLAWLLHRPDHRPDHPGPVKPGVPDGP